MLVARKVAVGDVRVDRLVEAVCLASPTARTVDVGLQTHLLGLTGGRLLRGGRRGNSLGICLFKQLVGLRVAPTLLGKQVTQVALVQLSRIAWRRLLSLDLVLLLLPLQEPVGDLFHRRGERLLLVLAL